MRLNEQEVQSALDAFFGKDVEPSPLDQRVRRLLLEFEEHAFETGKMRDDQIVCRWILAELRLVHRTAILTTFHDVIDQMSEQLAGFSQYASLLHEYARQRGHDLQYFELEEKVNDLAEEYVDLCQRQPENVFARRKLLNRMKDQYALGADHLSWARDIGEEVLQFLAEEEKKLQALEKEERASGRLKRRVSEAAFQQQQEIDQIDHYQALCVMLEKVQKFQDFDVADRDFLLVHAHERLQELYRENAEDLQVYFQRHYTYLLRERDQAVKDTELQKMKKSFQQACENNPVFRSRFGKEWESRLASVGVPAPRELSSCVRVGVGLLLCLSATAALTYDRWKDDWRQFFQREVVPRVQSPVETSPEIAPIDSEDLR